MKKINSISDINYLNDGKEEKKFRKKLQVGKDSKNQEDFLKIFKKALDNNKNKNEENIDER